MINSKADLHIHTALSSFADSAMTPGSIVKRAAELKLNIIGITDYNSTKQAIAVKKVAEESGIFVLTGAEVISKENIHALVYFDNEAELNEFQIFIDSHLPVISNDTEKFGYQIVYDEFDEMVSFEDRQLYTPLTCSLSEISTAVLELNGMMIAAHADLNKTSILSEIGCIPDSIKINALELCRLDAEAFLTINNHLKYYALVRGSGAKQLKNIGNGNTIFKLTEISFKALKSVLSFNINHDITII